MFDRAPIGISVLAALLATAGLPRCAAASTAFDPAVTLPLTEAAAVLPTSLMLQAGRGEGAAVGAANAESVRAPLSVRVQSSGLMGARSEGRDNAGGSLGVSRVGGEVDIAYSLTDTVTLTLGTGATSFYYSFDAAANIAGFRKLFNDLNEFAVDPGVVVKFDDKWTGIFSGRLRWAGEPNNAFSDGFTAGAFAIVNYKLSDEFSLGGGFGLTTRLEESVLVIPFLSFDWKINEQVTFRSRRLGAEVVVDLGNNLTFTTGGEYDRRDFRLDDSSQLPKGVVRDREVSLDATLTYKPVPTILLSLFGGAWIYRDIRIDNQNGDKLGNFKTEPAPYVGARVEVRF